MSQASVRQWFLPGVLVVASALGTAGCQREERELQREERRIPKAGTSYQGVANDEQPLSSFGPGTGGAGFQNIAPVQDRVGENLPPTAVKNVPPKELPGVAAGNPVDVEKLEQQQREGIPPPPNERETPPPQDLQQRKQKQAPRNP
ncbi:hypothetical protein LZ198_17220 [Myxococcus sp. K15C18031901]|uniref:hypothetical protein n=1 Tax=Myxococcus dinghuensis TaxID=2906761 RepID=UPI0020A6EFB9|nr:hypothetical protein [Myxococcus dinghuensis]MCP3100614.1 hypothetical protein [Myxococcus dinghuensis]